MEQTKQLIFEIIGKDLSITPDSIEYDTDLTLYGLDSMNLILLIIEIEERFQISIPDEKLIFENFSSIENIHRTIKGE